MFFTLVSGSPFHSEIPKTNGILMPETQEKKGFDI